MSEPVVSVDIAVSPGELVDRITILRIKSERLSDPVARQAVRQQLEQLLAVRRRALPVRADLERWEQQLQGVNEALWDIEDELRECEARGEFGPSFVEHARGVYHNNDRRAALKRAIDDALGSTRSEPKQHPSYGPPDQGR